jgi:drug/metabolite transporter (DMT)-like permease
LAGAGCARLRLRFSGQEHFLLMLLGLTLFSANHVLFYEAEKHLVSGSVAIIFSLLVVFNILNNWLLFGLKPDRQVIAGATLGLLGIVLTFWHDLRNDKLRFPKYLGNSTKRRRNAYGIVW